MTSLAGAESRLRLDVGEALRGRSKGELLEHAAMLAMLAFWAVPFTRATGGRGVHHELLFAALFLAVLPAIRAWRAPSGSLIAAAAVAAAAVLVCVFAPSHWYGSDVAAGYALGAAAYVAGRRYIRDAERRALLASCVCLAGLYQFEQAFVPWWGSGSAATEMSGTFYWHNPYAAFLLPGAVLGLGLILIQRWPWSLVGWVCTPVCTAGIVFSSSRATMAALVVAWVLVVALGVRDRRSIVRAAGAVVLTAGIILALPGPPLFPHYSAPWTATTARSASGQSLVQNGAYRTQFWREAGEVFAHRPLVGSGFHELATAGALYTPVGWARSPLAHNGYLQALSDGGLLLGIPFLVAALIVLWWALRRLWSSLRARPGPDGVLDLSVAIAVLAVFAHSAVDFDWSHPAILVEVALLAAMIAPLGQRQRQWWVSAVPLVALGGVLALSLPALHQWQRSQSDIRYSTAHELAVAGATFGNYKPARGVLYDYAHGGRQMSVAEAVRALQLTSSQAEVDIHVALLRDAVGANKGLYPDAVARARATLSRIGGVTPAYLADFALVLTSAGKPRAAQNLLAHDIAAQVAAGGAGPNLGGEIEQWALTLGTGGDYACVRKQALPLLRAASYPTDVPAATGSCPHHDQGHS